MQDAGVGSDHQRLASRNWSQEAHAWGQCQGIAPVSRSYKDMSIRVFRCRQEWLKVIFCISNFRAWDLTRLTFSSLKVPWHEIFFLQNMLPINTFIKVAFLFFQVWSGNLAQIPSFQNIGPWKLGMDFLVALITFCIHILVALNTIAWVYLLL